MNLQELLLDESEHALVICNKFPITAVGHFLVIPREHYVCLSEIPLEVQRDIFAVLSSFTENARCRIFHDGMNVFFNEGRIAGQTVPHFHIHVIFRREGDDISNLKKDGGERKSLNADEVNNFKSLLG